MAQLFERWQVCGAGVADNALELDAEGDVEALRHGCGGECDRGGSEWRDPEHVKKTLGGAW